MIISCPECHANISDKAIFCPHCGFVLNQNDANKTVKIKKRSRLPNGFGQISEIKNKKLRKPFRAMVTVGKNQYGKPICKLLKPQSYFKTYNEAYAALVDYNKKPFDSNKCLTLKELYEEWLPKYKKTVAFKTFKDSTNIPWKYCYSIYDLPVKEIRSSHIKFCMENSNIDRNGTLVPANAIMQRKIKALLNMILDYAVECDLVEQNYSRLLKPKYIDKYTVKKSHMKFTEEELKILWDNSYLNEIVDIILIQCYSGWRPMELIEMQINNVDINKWFFTGGLKTKAGKNRRVPIHEKIKDLVLKKYEQAKKLNSTYLINLIKNGEILPHSYSTYFQLFKQTIKSLNLNINHRPHDPRVQFVSMAKKYRVDEYAIKMLIGHAINDLTESVYTRRDDEWLTEEINKIV